MKKMGFIALICTVIVSVCSPHAFAQAKKVLFFESALAAEDTTFSAEATGYSKLCEALKQEGMLVASMSSGEISRQKLEPYDIVVFHPSPERPLAEREISALVWFVAQKDGALFVHGGTPKVVNPLTEIFGISMDSSNLVDTSSAFDESSAGRKFVLGRFPKAPDLGFDAIKSISFYGGAPLILSKDAAAVVTGDEDCYSDNGAYSIGSFPPVAAVAYLGRGVVFVKSDRAMLNNANIGSYQNLDWAKAVFKGLAAAQDSSLQRDNSLIGLRARIAELETTEKICMEERSKSEADMAAHYEKAKALQEELDRSEGTVNKLETDVSALKTEKGSLQTRLDTYENPKTLKIAAGVAGGIVFIVFLFGFFVGRRTMRGRI